MADQTGSGIVPAALMGDHSQQMQRIGILGIHRQDAPVESFGVGQPAVPVMGKGGAEHLRCRARREGRGSSLFCLCPALFAVRHLEIPWKTEIP